MTSELTETADLIPGTHLRCGSSSLCGPCRGSGSGDEKGDEYILWFIVWLCRSGWTRADLGMAEYLLTPLELPINVLIPFSILFLLTLFDSGNLAREQLNMHTYIDRKRDT